MFITKKFTHVVEREVRLNFYKISYESFSVMIASDNLGDALITVFENFETVEDSIYCWLRRVNDLKIETLDSDETLNSEYYSGNGGTSSIYNFIRECIINRSRFPVILPVII